MNARVRLFSPSGWTVMLLQLSSIALMVDSLMVAFNSISTSSASFPRRRMVAVGCDGLMGPAGTSTTRTATRHPYRSGNACLESQAIIIDVENLRGKSGFALTHSEVMFSLKIWTNESGLQGTFTLIDSYQPFFVVEISFQLCVSQSLLWSKGRVTLVIDHGSEPSAFWLPNSGYAVVFAGNSQKADDVMALDLVPHYTDLPKLTIVTADQDLIQRCRRASGMKQTLHVMAPVDLLDDLERILIDSPLQPDAYNKDNDEAPEIPAAKINPEVIKQLENEIQLGGELLEAEALLRTRSRVNNKRRKKLKQKVNMIREKLGRARAENGSGFSMVDHVTDILVHGRKSSSLQIMTKEQQDALLARWEKVRRSSNRREKTGDRVILAEQLRRHLLEKYGIADAADSNTTEIGDVLSAAQTFVLRRQSTILPEIVPSEDNGMLRIVVVSDTHGFEEQLSSPEDQGILPEGDVLLHLGDFALDNGPVKEYIRKFDSWLTRQPHPIKIVVRGNHDPRRLHFSHATYLTRPVPLKIGGYSFFFVPFGSRLTSRALPRTCDVVVSHVPPKGLLDRTYSGASVGCHKLRRAVERMKGGPPSLWLCGHIHEARGSLRHIFLGDKETMVINAANANEGMASCVEHGPTVVTLQCNRETGGRVKADIAQMEGQYEFINQKAVQFFDRGLSPGEKNELLVAVDLGLRTGVSLFNNQGELLRYEQFQFESEERLHDAAVQILDKWGTEASNSTHLWSITRIAIEGGSPLLVGSWVRAANGERVILQVKPDEWRADLLTSKEKIDGESAKAASRLIARQVVADYGVMGPHVGKFQTDTAESILLGLHVSRRLGWISRNPPVRRYSNGKVIVPNS